MKVAELFDQAAGRLPMVPKVVQELIASFQDSNINIDDITDKVVHDQVLSARVLRLANSARFGGSRNIGSLHDAVVMLGFDNVRMLVIASGIAGASMAIPGFDMRGFWGRSFEMANTSKVLAKLAAQDTQLAYTCGLLANIGELVLHVAEPEKAVQIDRVVEGGAERLATERMVLGMDLTEVGAELARRWNFPDAIQQAIRDQHHLAEPSQVSHYALLTGLSSYIVAGFNHGMSEAEMQAMLPLPLLAELGISEEKMAEALPHLKEVSTTVDALL
ncbi:HDOD domain-containing protein [Vogesella oryzae]|uniref:HDOD domain-containing protein n=1 Tax=Vogesella oryzae TaxID=1735285 RepID=UPI0015819A23|nr:HDOD domain-containing protein [Vogesella oryzae]